MKCFAAVLCVFLVLAAGKAGAGFVEGVSAYKRGDHATALREWRPLAEQGHADAQGGLGLMFFNAQGVPQDYIKAYTWLNLAAAEGQEDVPKGRDFIAKRMTPDQIAKAQRLAREWMEKHQK